MDEGVITSGQLYEAITLQVKRIFLSAFLEAAATNGLDGAAINTEEITEIMRGTTDREVRRPKLDELLARVTPENLHGEAGPQGSVGLEAW